MVGQSEFSHKRLQNKNCNEIQEMLFSEKGINFNNLPTPQKRGVCVTRVIYTLDNEEKTQRSKWDVDKDIPIFTKDRDYINKLV